MTFVANAASCVGVALQGLLEWYRHAVATGGAKFPAVADVARSMLLG